MVMQFVALLSQKTMDLSKLRAFSGLSVEEYCAQLDAIAKADAGTAAAHYRLGHFFL